MKILAVSDEEVAIIYSQNIRRRFSDVDLVIGCGDLSYYYQEFIVSMLDRPFYYVRGNHVYNTEYSDHSERSYPWGCTDLHRRVLRDPITGLLIAGLQGSLLYNKGPYQYSQREMWMMAFSMVPKLFINHLLYGRYLDVLVTHAPPWKVNDRDDLPHRGLKAFIWLIKVFKPAYHLHGHVHLYRTDEINYKLVGSTQVVNVFPYKTITYDVPGRKQ